MSATPTSAPTAGPAQTEPRLADGEPLTQVGESFKAAMGAVRRLRGRETQHAGKLSYAQYGLLFGLAAEPQLLGQPARRGRRSRSGDGDRDARSPRGRRAGRAGALRPGQAGRAHLPDPARPGAGRAAARSDWEPRWREALAEFDDEQLRSAAAVLDRLRDLFDELAGD